MPSIHSQEWVHNPNLPDVAICKLSEDVRVGQPQRVLVCVEPNGAVPLHTHSVDATMFIVSGAGWVLSEDPTNGRPVKAGDRVFFEREAAHGFRASASGLTFVSENGGIVDDAPESWDIDFRKPIK